MTGTRNPSRKYFKRNQPYFYKSADNWEEWDTDESYDRTFFIGIDDSNPKDIDVALYMIWGGKPVAAVGSKVLDTVSGVVDTARQLETEIQSILKEVQGLAAAVAQSQVDIEEAVAKMNALVDRCEGILDGAEAARDLAKDWATKMNGMVEEAGVQVDYSSKYYANEAKNSATAASTSATSASGSATTATEQAAAAGTSAEQAATSASTAASYASSAHIDASGAANSAQAAQDSADNAAQSATNAANSATISANSAIWAEGTDAQVQALGGVHSSKGWAEQSTNANIALTNSPYTTNRILEIPQDIKLELNNGTLTLKAGSKVYVPNGAGTFNTVTIASDVSTARQDNQDCIAWYNTDNGTIQVFPSILFYSGTTAPSDYPFIFWYDTTNNKCKVTSDSGSTWVEGKSFPICVVSTDGTKISAIKQVFNGFGYIGSTVFVLPGVKVQTPNGRNEDGTYNYLLKETTSVTTRSVSGSGLNQYIMIDSNGNIAGPTDKVKYDSELNSYIYTHDNSKQSWCIFAELNFESGKITSWKPYTVDSVVNSNEFYQLKDKAVTTDTTQTISGTKQFTQPAQGMSIELVADTNQQTIPAVTGLRQLGLYRNATYTKGDGYTSWIQAVRGSDGLTGTELYTRRLLESDSQEILNYVKILITPDGIPVSYTKTPPATVAGEEITTAGWFKQPACAVRTVIETYRNGSNWYRVWSDGWCEQGSMGVHINATAGAAFVINYFKPFSGGDNQMITITPFEQDTNDTGTNLTVIGRKANNFTGVNVGYTRNPLVISWYACGY